MGEKEDEEEKKDDVEAKDDEEKEAQEENCFRVGAGEHSESYLASCQRRCHRRRVQRVTRQSLKTTSILWPTRTSMLRARSSLSPYCSCQRRHLLTKWTTTGQRRPKSSCMSAVCW